MTLIVAKVNDHNCRAVIATNFTHSFCGAGLVRALKLTVADLNDPPAATTSDGTPIEFLGLAQVQLELGPWRSDGFMPMLVALECPADVLIGQDLIDEISKRLPVKFEFYKNSVNIGGTRVSMLDPKETEEKFLSVRVVDPRSNEEMGLETWKRGVRENMEMGGLVKRRVEVVGRRKEEEEDEEERMKKRDEEEEQKDEEEKQKEGRSKADEEEEEEDGKVELEG